MSLNQNEFLQLEAKLIEQEHRLFSIVSNYLFRKRKWPDINDPRRVAAGKAIIWRIFSSPTTIVVAGSGLLSFFTLYFLFQQNQYLKKQTDLFEQQTDLIENQNKLVQQQSLLTEASRRSSQVFIMGEVLSDINRELEDPKNKEKILSNTLVGRIISLSRAMKPYKYLKDNELVNRAYSPERGQLLISLLESDISLDFLAERIFPNANFDNSDLEGVKFRNKYLEGLILRNSNLNYASFRDSNLKGTIFSGSSMRRTIVTESVMDKARLDDCDCDSLHISFSDMKEVTFRNSSLKASSFGYVDMTKTDLRGIKIKGSKWGGPKSDIYMPYSVVDSQGWLQYVSDSMALNLGARIKRHYFLIDSTLNPKDINKQFLLIPNKYADFGRYNGYVNF